MAGILTNWHISVQVNIAAESGDMGILSSHVPSIEQLKPGLIEIIEESGSTKKFFRMAFPAGSRFLNTPIYISSSPRLRQIERCPATQLD